MDKPLKDITVEDIRLLPSCRSLTDDELQQIVDSIKEFAFIITTQLLLSELKTKN